MANFDVVAAAGLTVVDWLDPEVPTIAPSRLQARPGLPLKRYRALVRQPIRLEAVVAGVQAPTDSALAAAAGSPTPQAGFFRVDLVEGPVHPVWIPPALDLSSVVRFIPQWCGHYVVAVRRTNVFNGGSVLVPFDVESP